MVENSYIFGSSFKTNFAFGYYVTHLVINSDSILNIHHTPVTKKIKPIVFLYFNSKINPEINKIDPLK